MGFLFFSLRGVVVQALTENIALKIIALVIAVLLYTLVMFQEETERLVEVEVVPLLPAASTNIVMTSELPETVRIQLRGPRSILKGLKPGEVPQVVIDLRDRREGNSYYYFQEDDFEIPSGLQFIRVTPESVPIRLERLLTKQLPVRVITYGKLKAGAELVEEPGVEPSTSTVVGTAAVVRSLRRIETQEVDIEGLGAGEHVLMAEAKPIPGVSFKGSGELKVHMKVRWTPGQRVFAAVPVEVPGTELAADVKPDGISITLSGPKALLEELDMGRLRPKVVLWDDQLAKPGVYTGKVVVEGLPADFHVAAIVPQRVQVRLLAESGSKGRPSPVRP